MSEDELLLYQMNKMCLSVKYAWSKNKISSTQSMMSKEEEREILW